MRNERAWPQQCWKSCANGSNIVALRFGDHGTKEMLGVVGWKVWPVSNFAQQHPITCNRVGKRKQHDNIQQFWGLLGNNVASVWLHVALHSANVKIMLVLNYSNSYLVTRLTEINQKKSHWDSRINPSVLLFYSRLNMNFDTSKLVYSFSYPISPT